MKRPLPPRRIPQAEQPLVETPKPEVKITIPKPSELPAAKAKAAEPQVKKAKTMGMEMEFPHELEALTNQVLVIWDSAKDDQLKTALRPALMHVRERIQRRGLLQMGYPAISGNYKEMADAESWYLFKRPLDYTARCTKNTLMGERCKNRPLLGMEHCHSQNHATALEREQHRANTNHWNQHFKRVLAEVNLEHSFKELTARINWKAEK